MSTISPTKNPNKLSLGQPLAQNSALPNTCRMRRGLTTPSDAVITIRPATIDTFRLYGRKVSTTRRTVCFWTGPRFSSATVGGIQCPRMGGPRIRPVCANAPGSLGGYDSTHSPSDHSGSESKYCENSW